MLVTTGACEALAAVMLCILDPGDEVLITSPCYSPHLEQIRMAGGEAVFVPLDETAGWKLDVELVTRLITHKSKALIINTPLNPTGSLIDKDVLLELAEIAIRNRLFIVTDETYEDFIYDGSRHFSVRSMPELRECGISVFSFSKSYALTGWRCGYAVASAGIINQLLKVHDATCICAPLPGQYAALAALGGPQNCIQEFRSELLARRELVLRKLQAMRRISCVNPRAAYYILAKVDGLSDSLEYCISLLREAGVVVTPGGAFGPAGEGHFRISYCMSESVITEGLNRIIAFESARA